MKHKISLFLAALFASLFFAAGCGGAATQSGTNGGASQMTPEERADAVLAQMTLSEKIGQMVMIGVHGTKLDDDSRFMLAEYAVGGVILFDRNLETAEGVRRFTKELQAARHGEPPLFIAIDEEGGPVARMRDILPPPPAQAEIGESGDPKMARAWAKKTAQSLRGFGINLNFAPVADVGDSPRCYSGDAETTAAFVREAVQGYGEGNILCTLKHFPGLGKGEADTHLDTVVVDADKETLEAEDLVPFRALISQGDPNRFFVMVSHITYTALDENRPASFSPAIMTRLLREELGWQGIIVTDDLAMGAADVCPFQERGVRAVEGGADLVLICHEYAHQQDIYNGLLLAAQNGKIPESRIDESVRRILRAKMTLAESK